MMWASAIVLAVACATIGAAPTAGESPRLAGLVSRNTRLFLSIEDRAAFTRRAMRTDAVVHWSAVDLDLFRAVTSDLLGPLGQLLPPAFLGELAEVFGPGQGAVAVSVEGFVLENGHVEPDVLLVAEIEGSRAPNAASALSRIYTRRWEHRGITIFDMTDKGPRSLAVAWTNEFMFAARSPERIRQALDRALDQSLGSLLDSPRFSEIWGSTAPDGGSAFVFVDLRRLREESPFLSEFDAVAADLLTTGLGALAAFDGVGLTFRGVGPTFKGRLFLEEGLPRQSASHPLLARSRPLGFPFRLGNATTGVCSLRLEFDDAARILGQASRAAGGLFTEDAAQELLATLSGGGAGEALLEELRDSLGGEFALFVPGPHRIGELHPRLSFGFEIRDADRLEALLNRLSRKHPAGLRPLTIAGVRAYALGLHDNLFLSYPCVALVDGWLVGAGNELILRDVVNEMTLDEPRLAAAEAFLEPLDQLDVAPDQPGSCALFLDSPALVRDAVVILGGGALAMSAFGVWLGDSKGVRAVTELFDDPDFQAGLNGFLALASNAPGGVLVRFAGP